MWARALPSRSARAADPPSDTNLRTGPQRKEIVRRVSRTTSQGVQSAPRAHACACSGTGCTMPRCHDAKHRRAASVPVGQRVGRRRAVRPQTPRRAASKVRSLRACVTVALWAALTRRPPDEELAYRLRQADAALANGPEGPLLALRTCMPRRAGRTGARRGAPPRRRGGELARLRAPQPRERSGRTCAVAHCRLKYESKGRAQVLSAGPPGIRDAAAVSGQGAGVAGGRIAAAARGGRLACADLGMFFWDRAGRAWAERPAWAPKLDWKW